MFGADRWVTTEAIVIEDFNEIFHSKSLASRTTFVNILWQVWVWCLGSCCPCNYLGNDGVAEESETSNNEEDIQDLAEETHTLRLLTSALAVLGWPQDRRAFAGRIGRLDIDIKLPIFDRVGVFLNIGHRLRKAN